MCTQVQKGYIRAHYKNDKSGKKVSNSKSSDWLRKNTLPPFLLRVKTLLKIISYFSTNETWFYTCILMQIRLADYWCSSQRDMKHAHKGTAIRCSIENERTHYSQKREWEVIFIIRKHFTIKAEPPELKKTKVVDRTRMIQISRFRINRFESNHFVLKYLIQINYD